MTLAPIVLFTYARPGHTLRTLESLAANAFADKSDLIVYADAARHEADNEAVHAVRALVRSAVGFRSVKVIERPENYGLARNIIEGVSETLRTYESIIVLEDDMLTSPHFLRYMNEALARYAEDKRVVSIHGYVFPIPEPLPEAFFLPGADCWGWATWRHGWAVFNPDGSALRRELKQRKLDCAFDFDGSYPYTAMLEAQIAGNNDSWAVRWYASAFLRGLLTLYPGRSLVHNIGNDASGTHCRDSRTLDVALSERAINLEGLMVTPDMTVRAIISRHLRQTSRLSLSMRLRQLLAGLIPMGRA